MIVECEALETKPFDLPTNDKHRNFRWSDGISVVYFSAARKGSALSIHLAAGDHGILGLRRAVNDFCEQAFEAFLWCEMIIGLVAKRSIVNLGKKCGFEPIKSTKHEGRTLTLIARVRS